MLSYNSLENMNDRKIISILEKLFLNSTRDDHVGLAYIYIYIYIYIYTKGRTSISNFNI